MSLGASARFAWVVLLILPALAASRGRDSDLPLRVFLKDVIQLSESQFADLERGDVVTKQLPSPDRQEIAAFGIVRVRGQVGTLRERMSDWQAFRKGPQVPEIGLFSNPPRIEDLERLSFEKGDLDDIRKCRPGDCEVKADAQTITRLHTEVDWASPEAKLRASAIIKEQMLSYVRAYLSDGTDAMGFIVDKSQPKALSGEFQTLLKDSPYLLQYVPSFHQYLESFPRGGLPNTSDTLFWTKDTLSPAPVVAIYHATIHVPETPRPALLAAVKTLYASHYFNATLELMAAEDSPEAPGREFFLLDLYRTRIDLPTGMLASVLLGKVRAGIEHGVGMSLKTAKAGVEGVSVLGNN